MHLTNDVYDKEVETASSDQAWLIVFTKGIFSENPYDSMAAMNEILSASLLELSKKDVAKGLRVGFVDIHNEGELLKETYDLDAIPSVRLVKADKVYHLKWANGVWSGDELAAFVADYEQSSP